MFMGSTLHVTWDFVLLDVGAGREFLRHGPTSYVRELISRRTMVLSSRRVWREGPL